MTLRDFTDTKRWMHTIKSGSRSIQIQTWTTASKKKSLCFIWDQHMNNKPTSPAWILQTEAELDHRGREQACTLPVCITIQLKPNEWNESIQFCHLRCSMLDRPPRFNSSLFLLLVRPRNGSHITRAECDHNSVMTPVSHNSLQDLQDLFSSHKLWQQPNWLSVVTVWPLPGCFMLGIRFEPKQPLFGVWVEGEGRKQLNVSHLSQENVSRQESVRYGKGWRNLSIHVSGTSHKSVNLMFACGSASGFIPRAAATRGKLTL